MMAASFWSLLVPAVEAAKLTMENYAFISVTIGFSLGIAFVYLAEKFLPK
jgi:zinc transporter ZupT